MESNERERKMSRKEYKKGKEKKTNKNNDNNKLKHHQALFRKVRAA